MHKCGIPFVDFSSDSYSSDCRSRSSLFIDCSDLEPQAGVNLGWAIVLASTKAHAVVML